MLIAVAFSVLVLGLILAAYALLTQRHHIPHLDVKLSGAPDDARASKNFNGQAIPCIDTATGKLLGHAPVLTAQQVNDRIQQAERAAKSWKQSSFHQRRQLIRIILKYVVEHQQEICRVAALDSGKPMVDAAFGEVMVTCEKAVWLLQQGERWLRPERRSAGRMMFYKSAWVEYRPVGVVGAIVPFNYPFHNIFNPLMAAVFAGNGIVIKVSEHASWSALQYGRIIHAALKAAGAPPGLVQLVTGYAEAGAALAAGPINHLIFVGSTGVGKKVMAAAAQRLTPVTLELGGKDPFIICQDADLKQAVPTVLRGTFQSSGQNCAGVERVLVHQDVHDQVLHQVLQVVRSMRQGPAAGQAVMDTGAMCLPGLSDKVAALVQDARAKGAQIHTGGQQFRCTEASNGDFFPPTVITGVTPAMDIWREEVFGPVMCIVSFTSDEQAVALANDCAFGLGAAVFSRQASRARRIAAQLQTGMVSINDFAATYMCQSLPFGGVKDSGFGRFAGVEGLRALCHPVAMCQDRLPFLIRTDIPPMLRYPVDPNALQFVSGLVSMFYSPEWNGKIAGLMNILTSITKQPAKRTKSM